MKNYIDFSMDVVSNSILKNLIQQDYKENIVFRWLKRPCLMYCRDSKVLSQENLFYICFQFLDTLKQCNDLTDCQVQSEMQCIPYEVERIFDQHKYAGNTYQCMSDRLLVILTLYRLLYMIDCMLDEPQVGVLAKYLLNDTNHIIPKGISTQWYKERGNDITAALTQDSPIYKRSSAIIASTDCCEIDELNLIDYIQGYMVSPQKISEEIATHKENCPTKDCPTTQIIVQKTENNKEIEQLQARIKTLEESLQQKDKEIAELRYQQETLQLPTEDCVHIKSKYKSRVAAILSAMYYADYFQGEGNLTDKNTTITHILKYGFHYPAKSVSQLLSQYVYNGGNLDMLKTDLQKTIKKQLDDALADLTNIQQDRSKERK